MNENHIIRVIIQGYDRLSGVLNKAVTSGTQSLEKLRNKVNETRRDTDKSTDSVKNFTDSMDAEQGSIQRSRNSVDDFARSVSKLRTEIQKNTESAGEMFDRLKREGRQPRERPGFSPFISRDTFVQQEELRRAEELTKRLNLARARMAQLGAQVRQHADDLRRATQQEQISAAENRRRLFDGISFIDDIARGFHAGRTEGGISKDELNKRLADAKNARKIAREEAAKDHREELAEIERNRQIERRSIQQQIDARKDLSTQRISQTESAIDSEIAIERKALDEFILNENKKLISKKAANEAARSDELTDLRIISSRRSEKNKEEIAAAHRRIIEIQEEIRLENAQEAHASDQRVATRRAEFERISNEHKEFLREITTSEQRARLAEETAQRQAVDSSASKLKREAAERRSTRVRTIDATPLPTTADVVKQLESETRISDQRLTVVEATAKRAGRAFSDFGKGVEGGRRNLAAFVGDAGRAQSKMTQLGAAFGRAISNINQFVNVRWLFLVGILQSILTIIVQLAAALVAVASSAVVAAGALGGALASGLAQALPVIGLLAAAFNRLEKAMKVVQTRQQERNNADVDAKAKTEARVAALDSLADAHYNVKQAVQALDDSERGIRNARERATDAVKEQSQAEKDLALSRVNAARAIKDASLEQKEAALSLSEARLSAARLSVDADLEEKDSALALKEAEFGVLEAKKKLRDFEEANRRSKQDEQDAQASLREAQERLKVARAQGDQAEIAAATSAVSTARSSLNAIKDNLAKTSLEQRDLELGIKRASLAREQAQERENRLATDNRNKKRQSDLAVQQAEERNKRATQDNRKRQREGVEGSQEVIDARKRVQESNRAIRDSKEAIDQAKQSNQDAAHALIIAHRSVTRAQDQLADAIDRTTAKQRESAREFEKLSPAEQRFVKRVERLQEVYKKAVTPITDIIINAVNRGIDGAISLLQDEDILGAFKTLATVVADIGDAFTKWVISPEGRDTIVFFIQEATRNLPIIAKAAGNFALALISIAKAASPLFRNLVDDVKNVSERVKDWSDNSKNLEDFFATAGKHLGAWINLARAIGGLLAALIGASAGSGLDMINQMADAFDRLAKRIRDNPKPIQDFFDRVRVGLSKLLPVLGTFIVNLANAFTSPEFAEFTEFVLQTMIPALLTLIGFLGKLAKVFDDLSKLPILGPLLTLVVRFGLVYLAMKRLFPVIATLRAFLGLRSFALFGALYLLVTHWDEVKRALQDAWTWLDKVTEKFGPLQGVVKGLVAILAGGLGAFTLAGALILLIGRFRVLGTLTNPMPGRFGRMAQALAGPRGLVGLMGKAGLAGAIALASIELSNLIRSIPGWDNAIKKISEKTANLLEKIPGVKRVGRAISGAVFGKGNDDTAERDVEENVGTTGYSTIFNTYKNLRRSGLSHVRALKKLQSDFPSLGAQSIATIIPAAWATRPNNSFDKGGEIGGSEGAPIPIIAHAGEWVLNKMQQMKISSVLRTTPNKVAQYLFGRSQNETDSYDVGGVVRDPVYSLPGRWKGRISKGNIDIAHRPTVKNKDGSYSTVDSTSFRNNKGQEVLVPRVVNGRVVSPQEAWKHYLATGQNLGIFKDVDSANRYATSLHNQQAQMYKPRGSYDVGGIIGAVKSAGSVVKKGFDFITTGGNQRQTNNRLYYHGRLVAAGLDKKFANEVATKLAFGINTQTNHTRGDLILDRILRQVERNPVAATRKLEKWVGNDTPRFAAGGVVGGILGAAKSVGSVAKRGFDFVTTGGNQRQTNNRLYYHGRLVDAGLDKKFANVVATKLAFDLNTQTDHSAGDAMLKRIIRTVKSNPAVAQKLLENWTKDRYGPVQGEQNVQRFAGGGIVKGIVKAGSTIGGGLRRAVTRAGQYVWTDAKGREYTKEQIQGLNPIPVIREAVDTVRHPIRAYRESRSAEGVLAGTVGAGPLRATGVVSETLRRVPRIEKFKIGRDWSPPPKPLGTGTAVIKEQSTAQGNVGEAVVARMTGGKVTSGKGEGRGGRGTFDVQAGREVFEVKTMTVFSKKYQASPRRDAQGNLEPSFKSYVANQKGLNPRLAYVIVDPRSGRAHVYSRTGLQYSRLGEKGNTNGWTYHGFTKLGDNELRAFGGRIESPGRRAIRAGAKAVAKVRESARPILPGTTRIVPESARETERGIRGRIPAIYTDDNQLIVGRDGMAHGTIRRYMEKKGHTAAWNLGGDVEMVYYKPGGHGDRLENLWMIYAGEGHVTPGLINKIQAYRNAPVYLEPRYGKLVEIAPAQQFSLGGDIKGSPGKPVPIIAHAGEWVINKSQQMKLATRMRTSVREAQSFLFGTKERSLDDLALATRMQPKKDNPYIGYNYEIAPTTDSNGNTIFFAKLRDGRWGQITRRAAERITSTRGGWLPGYLQRAQGMTNNPRYYQMLRNAYASGGVVSFAGANANSTPSYGKIQSPVTKNSYAPQKNVQQNFNVKTEGETDWNYVMKLAAISAEG